MGRYAKGVKGVEHYYQPENLFKYAGEPFDVRISILDERPDDGLWAPVDGEEIGKSIGQLLDELVIGADAKQTEFIREHILELDEFPHLSDALDWVSDIWHRFRQGDADLTICVNNGPNAISLEDTAREHMGTAIWSDESYDYMLLDLVFEPGEMTLLGMVGERKQDFMLWMKGLLALYKLDIDASVEKHLRKRDDLEETREQLLYHNLVTKGSKGRLEITQQGRRSIGRVMAEHDEIIEQFDVFRDVVVRSRAKEEFKAEFGTLSGGDYRVAVYKHQDVDPYRAVFLLTLLSGELEEELKGKRWIGHINDDRFYERILAPVIDHSKLKPDELDEVVAQGQQYLARTSALRERARYSQGVLQRAKTIQAFPRRPASSSKPGDEKKVKPFTKASESEASDELGEPPLPEESAEVERALAVKSTPTLAKTRTTKFKRAAQRDSQPPPSRKDDDEEWL